MSSDAAWHVLEARHRARAAVAALADAAALVVTQRDEAARTAARDVLRQALDALDRDGRAAHAAVDRGPVR